MARRTPRPEATQKRTLIPFKERCEQCDQPLPVANHGHRTVTTLSGMWKLTLVIRQCIQPDCPNCHKRQRPSSSGRWALPHGEFGLDIIALIGQFHALRDGSQVIIEADGDAKRAVCRKLRSIAPIWHVARSAPVQFNARSTRCWIAMQAVPRRLYTRRISHRFA